MPRRHFIEDENERARDMSRRKYLTDLVSNFLTLALSGYEKGIIEAFTLSHPMGYVFKNSIPEDTLRNLARKSFNKNRANIMVDFIPQMKSIGIPDDYIVEITGLTLDEIVNYK